MRMYAGADSTSFAEKLLGYLQEVDYRLAETPGDKREVYRLRYDAYMREGAISENSEKEFSDEYDAMDNCWIFGIFLDQKLASSIRFHILTPENRKGPSVDVFPDIVHPMLDEGMTLVDPTRFVVEQSVTKDYPEIPFMTMRIAYMAYEYFNASYALATVRKEHAAFYRRVFKAEIVSDPRPYPTLKSPICMLRSDVRGLREQLARRYPIFESSYTERRMIFEPRMQMLAQNTIEMPDPDKVSNFIPKMASAITN